MIDLEDYLCLFRCAQCGQLVAAQPYTLQVYCSRECARLGVSSGPR